VIDAMVAGGTSVAAPAPPTSVVDQLLRHREALLDRIDRGDDLAGLARALIAIIAVCTALVGAAMGSFRGGEQVAYAAIKLPLVMLLTAALSAPTLTALNAALGRPASPTRDVARVLMALAFGSLMLLAAAPLWLLARSIEMDYHDAILLTVGCFAVGGGCAVAVLSRSVRRIDARGAGAAVVGLLVVFAMVGGQMAWTLRPYLVRPRTQDIPFVRDIEGSLYDAVLGSTRSAAGIYDAARESRR
jgi:hypothetical protein